MIVYFVSAVDDPSLIKIGVTSDLETRMAALASAFGDIELLAHINGGFEVESALHNLFADQWEEGEWFKRCELLDTLIARFSRGQKQRIWGRLRAAEKLAVSPSDQDKQIARDLLERLMNESGVHSCAERLSRAYERLNSINPTWSRRRVRAIWNGEALRIDHFEVRDMTTALNASDPR